MNALGLAARSIVLALTLVLVGCGGDNRYQVDSGSMEPTIKAGSTVVADEVAAGRYEGRRGDIVVFRRPASWPPEAGDILVKRVVATGGETVACCDQQGRVTVDGHALDEPYLGTNAPLDGPAGGCGGRRFGPVTVPADDLFVLGDTRLISVDSACHGPIPADAVIGVVTVS